MIDWQHIDTVLLDMDGTLLDLRFDNVLWNERLPQRFASVHDVSQTIARERLSRYMRRVRPTLDFYCTDAWSRFTGFDVAQLHEDLHASQPQLIRYRPAAQAFVTQLIAMGKDVRLVTNAHRASLAIKHRATGIEHHLPAVYSAHDFGYAKEGQQFWQQLQTRHHFHPQRTLMVDDTEVVLDAARLFGIAHTVAVTTPDSSAVPRVFQRHTGITHFAQLFPASTLAASTSSDW